MKIAFSQDWPKTLIIYVEWYPGRSVSGMVFDYSVFRWLTTIEIV